jgi:hypothetical protein
MPIGIDPSANTLLKMLSRDPRQQHSGILNVTDLFLLVFPVSGVEDTMKTSQIYLFIY